MRRGIGRDLPALTPEAELVIHRVAQGPERHRPPLRRATHARLSLGAGDAGAVVLEVADDGRGVGEPRRAAGIRGMREPALLVDGTLEVGAGDRVGTRLRLTVPRPAAGPA